MSPTQQPDVSTVASPPRRSIRYDELDIGELLGSGVHETVSKARLKGANETTYVALKEPKYDKKTLDQSVLEAFTQEATTWRALDNRERKKPLWADSEHIVGIVDTGTELPWIAAEYMDGGSLADRLTEYPDGYPFNELRWIGTCLCRGLKLAHDEGFAHLDLKPANVLFRTTAPGQWDVAKLGDWGTSRVLARSDSTPTEFSIRYAAPEQLAPDRFGEPDKLTDIYQVGVLLYTLAVGEPPYLGSPLETKQAILDGSVPVPPSQRRPSLPEAFDNIVSRALARNKHNRYRTIWALADELETLPESTTKPYHIRMKTDTELVGSPDTESTIGSNAAIGSDAVSQSNGESKDVSQSSIDSDGEPQPDKTAVEEPEKRVVTDESISSAATKGGTPTDSLDVAIAHAATPRLANRIETTRSVGDGVQDFTEALRQVSYSQSLADRIRVICIDEPTK